MPERVIFGWNALGVWSFSAEEQITLDPDELLFCDSTANWLR